MSVKVFPVVEDEYFSAVQAGKVPQTVSFGVAGSRTVDVVTGEDIWNGPDDIRVDPVVAATGTVVSTSAADAAAGTGIQTVFLSGLDTNLVVVTETITMNGVTPVPTVNSYLRINTLLGITAGSGENAAGDIDVIVGGNVQARISPGDGQADKTHLSTPAGFIGIVYLINYTISGLTGGNTVGGIEFHLTTRIDTGDGVSFGSSTGVDRDVEGSFSLEFRPIGLRIPEKSDVVFRAGVSASTADVEADYDMLVRPL